MRKLRSTPCGQAEEGTGDATNEANALLARSNVVGFAGRARTGVHPEC